MEFVKYSERCFVLFGNTKPYKEKLKDLGFKYNYNLTHPKTKEKTPGWIISKVKYEKEEIKILEGLEGLIEYKIEKEIVTEEEVKIMTSIMLDGCDNKTLVKIKKVLNECGYEI
uniref:Uncharacterized protein n=1 Tax=Pithovirus LCDPAC02 TaxID=2506601 RepID=A0A481YPH4_9VIRU|nr:MAG: hypothetical protein LCDPAC02_03470 [Pithovirus LCDPAC02]